MKAYWQRYTSWFLARNARERAIVTLALIGGIWFLGYSVVIEPGLIKLRRADRALQEATATTTSLQQQTAVLRATPVKDPDAPVRAELEQLKARLAEQAVRLQAVERSLVPPERMAALLESLLGRSRGLHLISLQNLAPSPVVEASSVADGPGGGLYKHGIELRVAGSYGDLLHYLQQLENAPQKLIWGRLDMAAEQYPRSVLTLTVYTLSLDKTWLTL